MKAPYLRTRFQRVKRKFAEYSCLKSKYNIVCVITQVHHSAVSSVHLEVVGTKLKAVGSDGILEAIPSPVVKTCIEVKILFTSVMEEIEEDTYRA